MVNNVLEYSMKSYPFQMTYYLNKARAEQFIGSICCFFVLFLLQAKYLLFVQLLWIFLNNKNTNSKSTATNKREIKRKKWGHGGRSLSKDFQTSLSPDNSCFAWGSPMDYQRDIVPLVCPGSFPGPSPRATGLKHLPRVVS